jgi:hypothetical protein
VNSEELEQSLRTEFESHLESVFAGMRQDFSQFQEKIEAEFDKHKAQLDAVFQDFSGRLETQTELDQSFKETVVEHLRLARDEGAKITAMAIAEAEEMEKQAAPPVGISELRDAINDITAQTSQATILKTLVQHAAQFTPRGAFFIIKNDHFVGWRVFGKEGERDEQVVREVFFPVSASTILGESVRSLNAVESSYGEYSDDSLYLNKLELGQPEAMIAIPLVARGRGVAVLYADHGEEDGKVNIEALETMVRVAGLTVEVLASAHDPKPAQVSQAVGYANGRDSFERAPIQERGYEQADGQATEESKNFDMPGEQTDIPVQMQDYQSGVEESNFAFQPGYESKSAENDFPSDEFVIEKVEEAEEFSVRHDDTGVIEENYAWAGTSEVSVEYADADKTEASAEDGSESYQPSSSSSDYQFESDSSFESAPVQFEETAQQTPKFEGSYFEHGMPPQFESQPFETAETAAVEEGKTESFENADGKAAESYTPETVEAASETAAVAAPQPSRSRFSDRNVDLPIEVSEDERRLHNDARRFARLLVSEIKLYNEQKVKEGREAQDLYDRLREAIDRSREMYDKRVQPPVASKFDYFHYELVSTLAEGEETNLGGGYPGAVV